MRAGFRRPQTGDAKAAITGAARTVVADYSYRSRTITMEPMNAVRSTPPTSWKCRGPTQNAEAALAASEASVPIAKCDFHKVHLGGGFGRRGRIDYQPVAVIAKQMPACPSN